MPSCVTHCSLRPCIALFTLLALPLQAQQSDPAWDLIKPYAQPPAALAGDLGQYRSPLLFNDGAAVQTPADWERRKQEIRNQWTQYLGEWPAVITQPEVEILRTEHRETFRQERIRFRWTAKETTEGWLLTPDGAKHAPAVIVVYYEPETAIGLAKPDRDFALQLTRKGFVCLSIGTTEASAAGTYALYHPSIENVTVQPLSMLGYAAANAWHVLAARPEVDPARIGITGHSFGGKWSMFASCLFEKFACAAWSDPGIVFDDTRNSINYWEPWYLGFHPKPWRKRGLVTPENPPHGPYLRLRADGRDLHELHALMAPRPFLVSGGSEDTADRWKPLQHSIAVNKLLGYQDRVFMTNRPDHAPNAQSNAVLVAFFEHFLKPTP